MQNNKTIFPMTNGVQREIYQSKGVNWNNESDGYTSYFWDKNISQFWTDTEYIPSLDKNDWDNREEMKPFKETYIRGLASLTVLDTKQGNDGVPSIIKITDDLQSKALLTFMAMMEQIHAKSYSTIFTTLISKKEVDEAFEWAENNEYVQAKADLIHQYYVAETDNESDEKMLKYLKHVASVLLESFLFYSGFFLPLYLSGGMGLMIHSGIIIKKIQDDEKLHGSYIGIKSQEIYNELTTDEQRKVDLEVKILIDALWENEIKFTRELYSDVNLFEEVVEFLKYNLNHAMENIGKEIIYPNVKINSAVENALSDEVTTGDLFSLKLKKYFKAKHRPLNNDDFNHELNELI